MLTPKWLSGCADSLVTLYAEAERSILDDMARRISTYDFYVPAAQYQEEKLAMMGMTRKEIVRALSARTGKCTAEIERIMEEGVSSSLNGDAAVYREAGKERSDTMSREMRKILRAGLKQTNGLFRNLTRTTAAAASKQFEDALDLAWLQVSTGAMDRNSATRQAVKALCKAGVQSVSYESGRTDSLETAVTRAIRTGVNQTALKEQVQLASELDMDLVETTAHAGARPEHAKWQGQVFSLTGKTRGYKKLSTATGYGTGAGLGGWNCRHSFHPWSPEMGRTYKKGELEEYDRPDAVEYEGRKMSLYEAEQLQRKMERNIRRWKRENSAMNAAGLDTTESAVKLRAWNARYKDYCGKTGLKQQRARTAVEGFGHSQSSKAAAKAKMAERAADQIFSLGSSDKNIAAYLKEKPIIDTLASNGVQYKQRISPKEIIVDAGTPIITGMRAHAINNLANKADRAEMTQERAQSFVDDAKLTLYQQDRGNLKFLALDGYAILNIDRELVTAVPQKWRKKYDEYLQEEKL